MIRYLLLIGLSLGSCSQLPLAYAQNFSEVNKVIFGFPEYDINQERFDEYEYSFAKIKFNRGPHSIVILAFVEDGIYEWAGKDNVKIEAIASLKKHSFLGEIFASALSNSDSSSIIIKEAVEETGRSVSHKLEKHLSTLATIATVAPLLGLFGTIIGMVELFSSFTSSGHDVAIFARGISVALYNTAGGIVVAVPAMIAYRFFRTKVDNMVLEMEEQAIKLLEVIHENRK